MELDLINFLLKLPKYPYIFNSLFLNIDKWRDDREEGEREESSER